MQVEESSVVGIMDGIGKFGIMHGLPLVCLGFGLKRAALFGAADPVWPLAVSVLGLAAVVLCGRPSWSLGCVCFADGAADLVGPRFCLFSLLVQQTWRTIGMSTLLLVRMMQPSC